LKAASDIVNAVVNDVCRPSQSWSLFLRFRLSVIDFLISTLLAAWTRSPKRLRYVRFSIPCEGTNHLHSHANNYIFLMSNFQLLQPKFASYLSPDTRTEIRRLVQSVIDLLGSPDVAIDDRHGPKLYSRFLEKLLNKVTKEEFASPASSSAPLPPRNTRSRRPKTTTSNSQSSVEASSESNPPLDGSQIVFNHPSPATSHSLSPPATSAALSFDQFAPVGATDPFASGSGTQPEFSMDGDFFQPPLPFDPEIMQSFQSLTDPNEWNDVSFPSE